jgi:hypothetical protein
MKKRIYRYTINNEFFFISGTSKNDAWLNMGTPDRQSIVRSVRNLDLNDVLVEVNEDSIFDKICLCENRIRELSCEIQELEAEKRALDFQISKLNGVRDKMKEVFLEAKAYNEENLC